MNVLWYYAIGFVVVWILAYLLRDRFNISIEGIVLMLKTERLEKVIDRIAMACPRLWKWYINIGIPFAVVFMAVMLVSLIVSLQLMFETPTVSLILPGVDVPGSPIYIPFATGLIALATVLVVHEGGHGVLARVEGISIDSVGLLLLAIIPGAFVEPNEEELSRANGISKLRVYSAGPMFNIALCIIALLLAGLISGFMVSENIYTSDGVEISSVVPSSPAEGVLSEGMVIHEINSKAVNGTFSYLEALNGTHIGDNLTFVTDRGKYSLITSSSPTNASRSYMGIRTKSHTVVSSEAESRYGTFIPWLLTQLEEIFRLMFFLNFAVGTFNLLPMKPLDGGLIFEELLGVRIRPDRRVEFNDTLNRYTRFMPAGIRSWISGGFNSLLDFISRHELSDESVERIVSWTSRILLAILLLLILYGLLPAFKGFLG